MKQLQNYFESDPIQETVDTVANNMRSTRDLMEFTSQEGVPENKVVKLQIKNIVWVLIFNMKHMKRTI